MNGLEKNIRFFNPRYIDGFDWGVPGSGVSMPYWD